MIDGICGGIAEYFEIDATIVRIVWVLVTLLGGSGLFLYIAAMIIMPVNPADAFSFAGAEGAPIVRTPDRRRFWGITFVLLGAFFLMINLGWLADLHWWSFSRTVMLPSLLILVGVVLMYAYRRRESVTAPQTGEGSAALPVPAKELRRSSREKKVFGVCAGVADYFNIDPTIVRVLYILLVLASFGWGLLLYIILAIVMPEEKPVPAQ
jgi:phage shock protein C